MSDPKLPLPTPPQPAKPVAADIPINPSAASAAAPSQNTGAENLTPPPSTLNPQPIKPVAPTPTQLKPPLPMPSPLAPKPTPLSTASSSIPSPLSTGTNPPLPKPPVNAMPSPLKPPAPGTSGLTSPTAQSTPAAQTKNAGEAPHIDKPGASGNKPVFAQAQKLPLKLILMIVGGVAVLGLIILLISSIFGKKKATPISNDSNTPAQSTALVKQTTLTYWGLWEPKDVMTGVLKDFETANPGILVNYVKQSPQDYRERLQTAIASGQGPDLFRFHASWTPMLKSELSPIPSSVMSTSDFQKNFFPVATQQLQLNGQYLGIPIMYDGLVLYYNEEIFRTANVQPPTTWADLRDLAVKLTVKSSTGIERGGLAIGNASNVEHYSDIIGLLMYQNGADPKQPTSKNAVDALSFYTNFAKVNPVWSDKLPSSTTAFARGEAAMMFAPSWRAHDVVALNPDLKFGMVGVPKLADKNVTWATYWAEGVNAQSKNKDASWLLIKYLSSPEVMQKLYSQQSQVRAFGEPYSRVDLAKNLATDKYLGGLFTDAPNAQSWYLCSFTHDNGLNDKMIKYYQDAVNAVLAGKSADEAMVTVDQGTRQLLRQYGLESSTTSQTSAGSSGTTLTR
jgi:multiple sugar transport system substrate-binding protein